MKLTVALIEELAGLDWTDPAATANRFMEETLVGLLDDYASRGHSALMTYHDKADPQSAREGIEALMGDALFLAERDPAFFSYLTSYPSESDRVTDVFFWSMDEFGLKPTLTLSHLAAAAGVDSKPEAAVVIKQLYAAHYFQSSLDLVYLGAVDPNDPGSDSYVMYVSRGRFDARLSGIERRMAERGLNKEARNTLVELQETLQRR
jgi:hypothetical protein